MNNRNCMLCCQLPDYVASYHAHARTRIHTRTNARIQTHKRTIIPAFRNRLTLLGQFGVPKRACLALKK